jgi:hypothetical protein
MRFLAFGALTAPFALGAQVRVSPTDVNVNALGATSVFLSYGGLRSDQAPAEVEWCGAVISAAPAIGFRCDPATRWGQLPSRYDRSRPTGISGYTDIMSIPPSVARRAYLSAQKGAASTFFYVRRVVSSAALPDEYVVVVCRLTGGGAGADVPLSLTDVKLRFAGDAPMLFVRPGEVLPPLGAEITYTGTGRLVGRWELVRPGEETPTDDDLLTEGTLPLEERGRQRRYSQLARFNVFLPPAGRVTLAGPDSARLPSDVEGAYLILLRVEASEDGAALSSLDVAGSGQGIVPAGAVAGFPLPVLRYVVGAGESAAPDAAEGSVLRQLLPRADAPLEPGKSATFSWLPVVGAAFYRVEIQRADGEPVHAAIVERGTLTYLAPPWLAERAGGVALRWRVAALDARGGERSASLWRALGGVTRSPP